MAPILRKFAPEYAKGLLRIAQEDLRAATILKDHGARKENTLFLSQQAAEKALKAVICHHDRPVPMINSLAGLLAALPNGISRPANEEVLESLTEFATIRRYEEGFEQLTDEDLNKAVDSGKIVLTWADKIVFQTGKKN